jgi:hypothetical protein
LHQSNSLPYFLTRYAKNSGSFCFTDIMAPTIEKDVAYHGPGNFERGCNVCMYRMRDNKATTIIVSKPALTPNKLAWNSMILKLTREALGNVVLEEEKSMQGDGKKHFRRPTHSHRCEIGKSSSVRGEPSSLYVGPTYRRSMLTDVPQCKAHRRRSCTSSVAGRQFDLLASEVLRPTGYIRR